MDEKSKPIYLTRLSNHAYFFEIARIELSILYSKYLKGSVYTSSTISIAPINYEPTWQDIQEE